ncbi:hypothetical protein BsWGS_16966 [Bradybaena similaris]
MAHIDRYKSMSGRSRSVSPTPATDNQGNECGFSPRESDRPILPPRARREVSPQLIREHPPNRPPPVAPKGVAPFAPRPQIFPPTAPERPPERPRQTPPKRPTERPPPRPAQVPLPIPPERPPGRPPQNHLSQEHAQQIAPGRPATPPPRPTRGPLQIPPERPPGRPPKSVLELSQEREKEISPGRAPGRPPDRPPRPDSLSVRPETFMQQHSPESFQKSQFELPPPRRRADTPQGDPSSYFKTNAVVNLTSVNFYEFIKRYEKALIMFFHSSQQESLFPSREFAKAADTPRMGNHAFAGVDCDAEKDLCCREQAYKLPIFRLYSNGFDVSTIRHVQNFNASQMHMMIKMSPVLTQPRENVSKEKWQQ